MTERLARTKARTPRARRHHPGLGGDVAHTRGNTSQPFLFSVFTRTAGDSVHRTITVPDRAAQLRLWGLLDRYGVTLETTDQRPSSTALPPFADSGRATGNSTPRIEVEP